MIRRPSDGFEISVLAVVLNEFSIGRITDQFVEVLLKLVLSQLSLPGIGFNKRRNPITLLKLKNAMTASDDKPKLKIEMEQTIMDFVPNTWFQCTQ
jgi:hypothetical protein